MKGNGKFGKWFVDADGLPAYQYTCNQYTDIDAPTFTTYGTSIDHYHQIGNDKITATVHNDGHVQVLESSRGFQWLTFKDLKKQKLGGGICLFQVNDSPEIYHDLYDLSNSQKFLDFKRIFGMGYLQKKINLDKLAIEHVICAPFSEDAVLISEITITNHSDEKVNIKVVDLWDIYLHHLLKSLVVTHHNRKFFGKTRLLNFLGRTLKFVQKLTKTDTDGSRYKFDKRFNFNASLNTSHKTMSITPKFKKKLKALKTAPSKHNFHPESIFLAMIQGEPSLNCFEKADIIKDGKFCIEWNKKEDDPDQFSEKRLKDPCLAMGTRMSLKEKEIRKVTCIFGYSPHDKIDLLIEKYKTLTLTQSILPWNASQWKKAFISLDLESQEWISRESVWHSYYIRSSCYYDEYHGHFKFPQGSIYLFGHGLDGGIRDYMLTLFPLIFMNPSLAREHLMYIIALMAPNGSFPYSVHGFGKVSTGSVHSRPSDLQLFFIWGLMEYIYTTKDFAFLSQKVPFYPKSTNQDSTVLERIILALSYLFSEKIGFGEHGLIKSNDGDWSDGISLMVKNRRKFIKHGESNFNSAFCLQVLQKLIPLLEKYDPDLASTCINKFNELKNNVLKTWNGKWFYRGYDGKGTPIGDQNIYLEHHVWLLLSGILNDTQALTLTNEIYEKLDKPSPIGQYISYPPQKTKYDILPMGWDVNGGIWHAMNGLLTWAYSKYDMEKAKHSLIKNSLTKRAEAYPHIWYGIWSGPDSYIASYAERAGEAFYHLPTPMCDFPLMNSNLHACYLLSIIKLIGFEADFDAITIAPKTMDRSFTFKSPLFLFESKDNHYSLQYFPVSNDPLTLRILKPKWWLPLSKITLNGKEVTRDGGILTINKDFLILKITNLKEGIKIVMA